MYALRETDYKIKMAAHSGGVDWTPIVKSILSANFGCFTKSDLLELSKAIIKRYNIIF